MAAVHRLTGDFCEVSFDLIAIHSNLEDYTLAYALNQHLKATFKRRRTDLEIINGLSVPIFEWQDVKSDRYLTFFTNKAGEADGLPNKGLFIHEPSLASAHIVEDYKEVDFFIKTEQDSFDHIRDKTQESIVRILLGIPRIITAYSIPTDKLKFRNNLIF